MGTTGLFGFHYLGKFYVVYSQCDSSPDVLGKKIVLEVAEAMRDGTMEAWKTTIKEGKLNTDGREEQEGGLGQMMARGHIANHTDGSGLPQWEPHGYVVNLDMNTLDRFAGKRLAQRTPLYQVDERTYDAYDAEKEVRLQMAHWADLLQEAKAHGNERGF
jgi:hypothetical protein